VRSPLPLAAASVLVTLVLVAVIGPFFVTGRANLQNLDYHFLPPFHLQNGFSFVLGADGLGRPMLLQVIIGARTSFITAGLSVGISAIVGSVVGMISGYFGGWLDAALMRISDVIQTMPSLMLALAILFVVGPSIRNLILVLAVTRVPVYMRVARSQTLEIRERVFVEAARAIGSSTPRMIARDISPLVIPTIMTVAMLEIANVILAAAGLSFLGVGLQRPDVDWGMLVAGGRSYLTQAWWVTLFPGLAVVITALAANILSNWLRAIEDPAQSGLFVKTPRQAAARRSGAGGSHGRPPRPAGRGFAATGGGLGRGLRLRPRADPRAAEAQFYPRRGGEHRDCRRERLRKERHWSRPAGPGRSPGPGARHDRVPGTQPGRCR